MASGHRVTQMGMSYGPALEREKPRVWMQMRFSIRLPSTTI